MSISKGRCIVERVYWQAEIPISQARGTRRCEKITDHNIGVKPLSVAGANPARSKKTEAQRNLVQWRSWLAYLPVTQGVAGSSPVWTVIYLLSVNREIGTPTPEFGGGAHLGCWFESNLAY